MPESRPPIELQGLSLAELQKLIDERRLPPVDQWNPEHCGHSGMHIARDGSDGEQVGCVSRGTAPGITRALQSAARPWPGSSRRCCGANPMAATCW